MSLPPLEEINRADASLESLVKAVSLLFEPAPPLAKALFQHRPYTSYAELINKADSIIQHDLNHQERLQVINAHPRLGAPKQTLSALSFAEQGYTSAPSTEDQVVNETLAMWNQKYEEKHGFKFVLFVNGRPRKEVIPIIMERIQNSSAQELETGLRDMLLIAKDRLSKLVHKL